MITIRSLENTHFDTLADAFSAAFKDYDFQISKPRFKNLLIRRGYDPKFSFGAFDEDKLVAFILNGLDLFNGKQTVYDVGTGTIKAYRGQKLAGRIFDHALPKLKEVGYEQYMLEVLKHNTKAYKIYLDKSFKIAREFGYHTKALKDVNIDRHKINYDVEIIQCPLDKLSEYSVFHDFVPSWQNNLSSIHRIPEDFKALIAVESDQVLGYCVFVPESGDVTLLAVDHAHRRCGIASRLMSEMLHSISSEGIRFINVEVNCKSMVEFLSSINIPAEGYQYEMIREL